MADGTPGLGYYNRQSIADRCQQQIKKRMTTDYRMWPRCSFAGTYCNFPFSAPPLRCPFCMKSQKQPQAEINKLHQCRKG